MHFEFLVEGQVENTALSILMPMILGPYGRPHSWKIHPHQGIGRIPDDPADPPNGRDRSLLHNLPSRLRAYGKENRADLVVVILVDLDNRPDCVAFKTQLVNVLSHCNPPPTTLFRIAVEELEAWFLGDATALRAAYPKPQLALLNSYQQDTQCGTWELLADIVHPGGHDALVKSYGTRSRRILEKKREWARTICPKMQIDRNRSPSFRCFVEGLRSRAAP